MHIPDGFVSEPINVTMAGVALVAVGYGLSRLGKQFRQKPSDILMFAAVSAFIFAAQMLNFSIGGGTSGHFLGAVLAAALLGPWGACVSLALVLAVQGFVFGDGGIAALGTNIVNMGLVGGFAGYAVRKSLQAKLPGGGGGIAVAGASWASIVAASAVCSAELALSGTSQASVVFPAMVGTHALIGIGEAAITLAALAAVAAYRRHQTGERKLAVAGVVMAILLATFASPLASSAPDGLEKVAQDHGFMAAASEDKAVWSQSPMADYSVAAIEAETVSTGIAGLIGTLLVFGFAMGSARMTARIGKSA